MNRLFYVIVGVFLFLMMNTSFSFGQDYPIKIVTEEFPLYNYEENHQIKGISTEVVQAVLKELDASIDIRIYPWTRAYKMALTQPNILIYSIGRIEEREHLFKWIGVVAPYDVYFYSLAKRTDLRVASLGDAKKYRIATTKDDAREQYLVSKGFKKGDTLSSTMRMDLNIKMLFHERVDLIPLPELVMPSVTKKAGYKPADLKKVFQIKEISSNGLYMAFSKKTPDAMVTKFRDALKRIKVNGTYDRIIGTYRR